MKSASTKLFLPLTYQDAHELAYGKTSVEECFSRWSLYECSAAAVIQRLAHIKTAGAAERVLSKLIDAGIDLRGQSAGSQLNDLLLARFELSAFKLGFQSLRSLGISFMTAKEISERKYCLPRGHWNFEASKNKANAVQPFKHKFMADTSKQLSFSESQRRVFTSIQAAPDEHVHIEALAGTGKSHMIGSLLETLKDSRPLVLALTMAQLNALHERFRHIPIIGMTIGEFSLSVLQLAGICPPGFLPTQAKPKRPYDSQLANSFAIQACAGLTPAKVASVAWSTLVRFCNSQDKAFNEAHIPYTGTTLPPSDAAYIYGVAMKFWDQICYPDREQVSLPAYGYHINKFLCLTDLNLVPHSATHIIVDEAHDIPAPLFDYFARTSAAVITLGDFNQQLDGNTAQTARNVRRLDMTASSRAGTEIEAAVNPLLRLHPQIISPPIIGNPGFHTEIVYYDRGQIPTEHCLIITANEWGILEYCQRLYSAGSAYRLIGTTSAKLEWFVRDAYRLFKENRRSGIPSLLRFASWDDLCNSSAGKERSFQLVRRMFEKGYTDTDIDRLLLSQAGADTACYLVGRVQDTKNHESNVVMVSPDLLLNTFTSKAVIAKRFAALYTSATRTKHRLYLPMGVDEWAQEQAGMVKAQGQSKEG